MDIGYVLLVILVIGIAAWLLAAYVSGTLAALVVIIGVVYVLYIILGTARSRRGF